MEDVVAAATYNLDLQRLLCCPSDSVVIGAGIIIEGIIAGTTPIKKVVINLTLCLFVFKILVRVLHDRIEARFIPMISDFRP